MQSPQAVDTMWRECCGKVANWSSYRTDKRLERAYSLQRQTEETATLAPPPMYAEPCHAVSLHCDNFTTSTSTSIRHQRLFSFSRCLARHSRLDYSKFMFAELPAYLQRRLQAVLNAAARLVFRLRRYDHVTDALAILHCQFQAGADGVPCAERYGAVVRGSICSGIQPYWSSPSTVVFRTAAARAVIPSVNSRPSLVSGVLNTLPDDIQSAPSVSAFRRLLKTFLFQRSFPDVIL